MELAFQAEGDQIAAVIFEPVAGNMGCVVASQEFLQALRMLTTKHGTVLICDEVMSGFRVALGGAQERLGIEPDLTTMGKIVGGGLPGRRLWRPGRDHARHPARGKVFQAGTLSGNPLATAAGSVMLKQLTESPPYDAWRNSVPG